MNTTHRSSVSSCWIVVAICAGILNAQTPTRLPDDIADLEGDSDGDGIRNAFDRCPGHDDRRDKDQDGMPDGCDWCPGGLDTDVDGDGVPDGCDNCPGMQNPYRPRPRKDPLFQADCRCDTIPTPDCCWQLDTDGDGKGDRCDNSTRMKMLSVQTMSGDELESFEYDGEILVRHVGWDGAHSAQIETRYVYDRYKRLVGQVRSPLDGSAKPRETTIFYDALGHCIGNLIEGEAGDWDTFMYRNRNSDTYMTTTATDPPHKATILEYRVFDTKHRLVKRFERLPETDKLACVTSISYRETPEGDLEKETRIRVDDDNE